MFVEWAFSIDWYSRNPFTFANSQMEKCVALKQRNYNLFPQVSVRYLERALFPSGNRASGRAGYT